MPDKRCMPEDWDDHAGWEGYYAGVAEAAARIDDPLPFGYSAAIRFTPWLAERGYRKVWFPGCGLDGSPRVYASLGCEVWATDVSPSAVAYQRMLAARCHVALGERVMEGVRQYLPDLQEWRPGMLHALVHDFRQPFPQCEVDCILNIRSYQALPPNSMKQAAQVFFATLRPGGQAFFDTQNVQGERRDRLEDALLDAGFTLPGIESERWFRHTVAEADIPHNFVLGRPWVLRQDARYHGTKGAARLKADEELLHTFVEEFKRRVEAHATEVERLWNNPDIRIAQVVYNTG